MSTHAFARNAWVIMICNVYFFVLDGYVRQDVLQTIIKYNNGEFIRKLKNEGFYIANKSKSNYNDTARSFLSTFEMEYLFTKNKSNRDSSTKKELIYD